PGRAVRGGGHPAGRAEPAARPGRHGGAGAGRAPRRGPDLVHRRASHRGEDHGLGGAGGAAGRARAGRQEPQHRVRRHRLRHGGGQRADRGVPALGAGVFGPVVTVERFGTEEEAIRLGNDTSYGLAGAVWTSDAGQAERVAGALRHGTVWINDYHPYLPQAEWGGFGKSGIGRELGPSGLEEYQEKKHIYHNTSPAPAHWFS